MDYKLYLNDPGICKKRNYFYYNKNNKRVTNQNNLDRLSHLRVPPAWENVWYASTPKCHIQVYGNDNSGKKQYIFSQEWVNNSVSNKFERMKHFIKDLGAFKRYIKLPEKGVIDKPILTRLLFHLLMDTHIRVGNEIYASTNGSYGLTTLRQKHLLHENGRFLVSFVGKSCIRHTVSIPKEYNYYIKKLIVPRQNSPLFWYKQGESTNTITSEELNTFLKENMGNEYTCKDFRTYSANILFIKSFLKNVKKNQNAKVNKIILDSIDATAEKLGHTRNISRKSYISNNLLDYCRDHFDKASSLDLSQLVSKVWD